MACIPPSRGVDTLPENPIKRGVQGLLKQFGYRLARANDSVVPNCGLSNFFH